MSGKRRTERNGRVGLARWRLREGDSALAAGRLPEALDLYAVAAYELDGLDRRDGEVAALLAHALAGHGRADLGLGNPQRALETLRSAVELTEPNSAMHAGVLSCLACALRETGALDDAVSTFTEVLAIQRKVDRTGAAVVGTLNDLSHALMLHGRAQAAERAAREAVELAERIAPGGPAAAISHHHLRQALDDLGRTDEAEAHLTRAIALLLRHAPDAPVTADAINRWCEVLLAREGPHDALPCIDRHLAVIEPDAPGAPVVGVLRLWRGIGLASLGSDEADTEALREFEAAERVLAGHLDQAGRVAWTRVNRAKLLLWHQAADAAEPLLLAARAHFAAAGDEHAEAEAAKLLACTTFERLTASGRGGTVEALSAARRAADGFAAAQQYDDALDLLTRALSAVDAPPCDAAIAEAVAVTERARARVLAGRDTGPTPHRPGG
ncbi:tetratricopeptide repeat protein [Saccharothrix stipae]